MPEPPDDAPGPRARRILIIEDHADTAESLAACLRIAGHRVETASGGVAGVEAARRFAPEVVLTDIQLPDIDGYQVAQALKADPQLANCYVVALSGSEAEWPARGLDFDERLVKPVEPKRLLAIVARAGRNG